MIVKKSLSLEHTLIRRKNYPFMRSSEGGESVFLGIGGNVGNVLRRFEHLFAYLNRSSFLRIVETAPILKNPPFGYDAQADFYNTIIHIETTLRPKALLAYLLRVEKVFGRKRSFANAPRTLDIDILFYGKIEMHTAFLTLPHPAWSERNSVLIPLSYMRGQ
jgi:2-amino-4-hydroxy-6-hydroxymethyldihydropteridine diphosphokinase